jgi:capsular exopolysaccharide synthesis family protein
VILVDGDLRYPKLHNVWGLPNRVGLTSVLRGDVPIEEALQQTEVEGLQLLSAGPIVVNPSEMLGSRVMRSLHEDLKRRADFVLFDTPSAIAFSDSAIMASFIDRTLMVVRASNVPRGSEERVLSLLNKAGANILGVVLNDVPAANVDSVHYHYHYYPVLPPGSTNTALPMYANSVDRKGNGDGGNAPLALPLGIDSESTMAGGQTVETATVATANGHAKAYPGNGKSGLNGANGTSTEPFPAASAIPAHATYTDKRPPKLAHAPFPWKTALLALLVAGALGALVLTLAGGANVK